MVWPPVATLPLCRREDVLTPAILSQPFEPFADCNECNAPAGDYGCASLALVETKSSIVPLCCECQRKMKDKGKIKVSFVWTK